MKSKAITLLFSILTFFVKAQVITNGLIGYYPFSGDATDQSGSNNNGIVYGAVLTSDRFGNANSAYQFDGVNDYISVNPATLLNPTYSYSMWVKANTISSAGMLGSGSVGGDQAFMLNTSLGYGIQTYNTGGPASVFENSIPSTSNWYHLVATRSSNMLALYVNGQLINNISVSGTPYYGPNTMYSTIGSRDGTQQFFSGLIDEVGIYNRGLEPWEVLAIYNGAVGLGEVDDNLFDFNIYPNPTNNKNISIQLGGAISAEVTVTVFDITGKSISAMNVNKGDVNIQLPELAAGIYNISAEYNGTRVNRRLVIQ